MRFWKFLFISLLWVGSVEAAPVVKSGLMDRAPVVKSSDELDKLVDYLIRPYKTDEEKAYVLLDWIVNFVDYDAYRYEKMVQDSTSRRDLSDRVPEQGDILKTRLGVCSDISSLYVQMLHLADMKAEKINGCLTTRKWQKGDPCDRPHAWVAVWIDKQWELVDPTFAMGQANAMMGLNSTRGYKKEVKKRESRRSDTYESRHRRLLTRWFMTNSKEMARDHQPDDEVWLLKRIKERKNKNLKGS